MICSSGCIGTVVGGNSAEWLANANERSVAPDGPRSKWGRGSCGENEAVGLLHVIARRWAHCPDQDWQQLNDSDQHRNAVTALKQAGLLYSDTGPHRVLVNDDVLFSLLYYVDIDRQFGEGPSGSAPSR